MERSRLLAAALLAFAATAFAASYDSKFFAEMRWRSIGPYRGGRTRATAGVPGQPNVFYIGVNNGGVWKTTDYGRSWFPVFDDQPTQSIGAVAVAPSDPNIVYVWSGEGLQRPHLAAPRRAARRAPDRRRAHRSRGSEPRLRCGAGAPVRRQRRAWRLSHDRWRTLVAQGPVQGREHRCHRPRLRPVESADRVRRPLGGEAGAMGIRERLRRHHERVVQVDRWR